MCNLRKHKHPQAHTHANTHPQSKHASPATACSQYSSAKAAILNLIVGKDEKLRRFTKVLPEFHKLHLQAALPPLLCTPSLYPYSLPPSSFYVLLTVVFAQLNNALPGWWRALMKTRFPFRRDSKVQLGAVFNTMNYCMKT